MRILMGLLVTTLAASPLSALSAAPDTAADDWVVTVAFGDLDLTDQAHVARLDRRVGRAVNRACLMSRNAGAAAHMRYSECRKRAMQDARLQMERAVAAASQKKSSQLASR